MQLPKGVEWAAHCLVVLERLTEDHPVANSTLAEVYGLSPTYLNKHLQALTRHGLLISMPGSAGGFTLSRPASEITLADVVEALEGGGPIFRCTEIRCDGLFQPHSAEIRASGPCAIAAAMWTAEQAWRHSLAAVSITDLVQGVDAVSSKNLNEFVENKKRKVGPIL
ncbi:Rrf2 family transcriptional regulator [Cryobacterium levicorallinum]|uniref:Rrf2 family transcriptional regulator n=1 Tax=Cryobacterium levicorallinum TaxID=995038 RepID=A0A4R8VJH0_9MICO|nr:Rrf2 family transcriptional regulator [Cryobacterium levicorallinum]TFB82786.1 Rrf2 family transcriptional regulator [Cryobacterium levicorallinum]